METIHQSAISQVVPSVEEAIFLDQWTDIQNILQKHNVDVLSVQSEPNSLEHIYKPLNEPWENHLAHVASSFFICNIGLIMPPLTTGVLWGPLKFQVWEFFGSPEAPSKWQALHSLEVSNISKVSTRQLQRINLCTRIT